MSEPNTPTPIAPTTTVAAGPTSTPTPAIFDQIVQKIIAQQEAIIGPVAIERAKLVGALQVDWRQHTVGISGDPRLAIDELVRQYKELFGQIAVETCREVAATLVSQLPPEQQPSLLK